MPEERVPPGQSVTEDFPVLQYDGIPEYDEGSYRFEVTGEVNNQLSLTLEKFKELGQVEDTSDFHCVTGWSKLDVTWTGVPFETVAEAAGMRPGADSATVGSLDDYTTSLPLEELMRDDVLFATELEGEPLSPEHGGPVRLVVPHKYAYKAAKWVNHVEFTDGQEKGYWEKRGYSNTADPWENDRYSR